MLCFIRIDLAEINEMYSIDFGLQFSPRQEKLKTIFIEIYANDSHLLYELINHL